jgi:ubiquinone/menaquinone biosynthesis C-methylase UbiE
MPRTRRPIPENWYHLSFDALYPVVYAHRTVEAARPESLFSIRETGLRPADFVLDLCCGSGRHMHHLLEVTPHVVGLDYSSHMLEMAEDLLGTRARLVRADMCCQPFTEAFDVVVNYFTSFGYFSTYEANQSVLRGIARILRPGGRFFIDYLSRAWTERHLQEDSRRSVMGFEIHEHRWIDHDAHRINKTTVVARNGQQLSDAGESVQLFSADEFRKMLSGAGLRVDKLYGDYDGAPHDDSQPRMIAVGHKA